VSETPQLLSIKKARKWGSSHVVTLSKEVRVAMGLESGDTVVFRKIGRYVFIVAAKTFALAPVTKEEIRMARAALEG
jgi:antitoxin component of MazEF toxin-antitoxin module